MTKKVLFLLFLSSFYLRLQAQQAVSTISPNRAIAVTVRQMPTGTVTYQVAYKGKPVLAPSGIGFNFSKPKVSLNQFTIVATDSATHDDTWQPVWGETKTVRNHNRELALTLQDKGSSGIQVRVRFRVFDDGVGFRYEFPEQKTLTHFVVDDELTQFAFTADHKTFWQPGDYDSNEYLYNTTRLLEVEAVKA